MRASVRRWVSRPFSICCIDTAPRTFGTVGTANRFYHNTKYSEKKRHGKFSVDRSALDNSHLFAKSEEEILRGKEPPTPLARDLLSYIQFKGPISLHDYMAQAANHALHGYYQSSQEKIGEKGDFITAPELGQLFGEMLGVWVLLTWKAMGSPSKFNLIELGPGKGTLMKDMLKVGSKYEDFRNAVSVHFVELSNDLRIKQLKMLQPTLSDDSSIKKIKDNETHELEHNIKASWYSLLHQVPIEIPCIIIGMCCYIANIYMFFVYSHPMFPSGQEFLDAFPVHQFVYTEKGWREKLVDIDESPSNPHIFRFALSPSATPATKSLIRDDQTGIATEQRLAVKVGDGIEISPLTLSSCEDIGKRVVTSKGAAILIDYGEDFTQEDSLRGFQNHQQVHILSQVSIHNNKPVQLQHLHCLLLFIAWSSRYYSRC
jgi:NADH dehydrogenase [ubiquinone] 1 alpha subcomplex assembly factor 7